MKKTINIDGVDPILFVGLNDQNIKVLEQNYNSKIVVRGSSMNLDGKKEEIIDIELVVQNMLTIINQKGSISIDDIQDLISNDDLLNNDLSDQKDTIVLHSHGGPIFARTKGQKKYLHATLDNDIDKNKTRIVVWPEVAVPLLVEIIRLMSPTSAKGKKAYQDLLQLGFVETPYRGCLLYTSDAADE